MFLFAPVSLSPRRLRTTVKQIAQGLPAPVRAALRVMVIPPLQRFFRYIPQTFGKRSLWDNLASHLWWLESTVAARTFFGSTIYVDARDICGRYIYYFGVWEPNLTHWISQRLNDGDVFVDVGANVGYYSLLASTLVGGGHVVAVEALPKTFAMFQRSIGRNHTANVRAVNIAAWHEPSVLTMFSGTLIGKSTLIGAWAERWKNAERCEVPASPLSEILTPDESKSVRIVKIDVEGAEWHVISGMTQLLENSRRDLEVVMEVTPTMLATEGHTCDDLLAFFARYGFRPYFLEMDYSASAYYGRGVPRSPRAITDIPTENEQQTIIFSRL